MIATKKRFNQINCPYCNEEIFYEKEDIEYSCGNNKYGFYCPTCFEFITFPKKQYPLFPDDFYYFGNGVNIKEDNINETLIKIKEGLKDSDVGEYYYWATGNTIIFGVKNSDGISIFVSKDYYEVDLNSNGEELE